MAYHGCGDIRTDEPRGFAIAGLLKAELTASPWIRRGGAYNTNDNSPIHSTAQQQKTMQKILQALEIYVEGVSHKAAVQFLRNFRKLTQLRRLG